MNIAFCVPFLLAAPLAADPAAGKHAQPGPAPASQSLRKDQNGESLTPHVQVTRQGRVLKLDYELLDAHGIKSSKVDPQHKPQFKIYQDGREIASGNFEYG